MKTRMHEILGVEPFEKFQVVGGYEGRNYSLDKDGWMRWGDSNWESDVEDVYNAINNGIIRKPQPGCWHCWNIEAHKIKYVTAVKDKDGRPMNTPTDIPYRYCPSCGRKLEVGE